MSLSGQHPHTAAHVDSGLQPERTVMAWSRTALACCIVSAFMLRWLLFYGAAVLVVPALTLAAAVTISVTQQRRIRDDVLAIRQGGMAVEVGPALALLGVCWALGACGLVLVILA
ncbi:MAG: DUF202 domain-containing protein [Ornithinimicrobium sp.]